MCGVCGCGQATIDGRPAQGAPGHHHGHDHHHDHHHHHGHHHDHHHDHHHVHDHGHDHGHHHHHDPDPATTRVVQVERDILAENDRLAAANRAWFAERGVLALNLVSSPGSGKTTLLARTIADLGGTRPLAVIEGDQQTDLDAERIRATGAPAVQVNTGKGCHLDAAMVARAATSLDPAEGTLLFIENVGNLVCPAAFDLGEGGRVVILSVTEGEDKPLKYPDMFHAADLMILNKIDLLPHVTFDVDRCVDYARRINPKLPVLSLSATTGQGMAAWIDWSLSRRPAARVSAGAGSA
jgi:hydrogenase nickel incorporation protein HypB